MTLPTPPTIDQLQAKNQPNDDCGEACVTSVLQVLGKSVTLSQATVVLAGLTNAAQLVDLLGHFGVDASFSQKSWSEHYNIVGIFSDAGGNPLAGSPIGHWVLQYGPTSYMNPYGGRLVDYPTLPRFGDVVNVHCIPGGYSVPIDLARVLVWDWYAGILGRRPDNQAAVDFWAGRLAAGEPTEAVITAFSNTPEAKAKLGG